MWAFGYVESDVCISPECRRKIIDFPLEKCLYRTIETVPMERSPHCRLLQGINPLSLATCSATLLKGNILLYFLRPSLTLCKDGSTST